MKEEDEIMEQTMSAELLNEDILAGFEDDSVIDFEENVNIEPVIISIYREVWNELDRKLREYPRVVLLSFKYVDGDGLSIVLGARKDFMVIRFKPVKVAGEYDDLKFQLFNVSTRHYVAYNCIGWDGIHTMHISERSDGWDTAFVYPYNWARGERFGQYVDNVFDTLTRDDHYWM